MRVLIALDASAASRKVIDYLLRHPSLLRDAQLSCVHIDVAPPLRAVGAFGADPGMPSLAPPDPEAMIEPVLAPLRAAFGSIELIVRSGEPGPEIAQIAADGNFDLVVLGAGRHGLLRRKLLGSVAAKLVEHCPTAVLVVR